MQLLPTYFQKKEVIDFRSFVNGSYKHKQEVALVTPRFAATPFIFPMFILGDAQTFIVNKIVTAFDPLFALIQGISFPLAFLSMSFGCVMIMTGNKHKGIEIIKWAALGFILLQFVPGIMQILVEVSAAMKTSSGGGVMAP